MKAPRQARSRATEARLLQALASLLAEADFESVTIQSIAARAGVAVGTVYRRFADKDAMLEPLYQRLDAETAEWTYSFWRDYSAAPALDAEAALRAALCHFVTTHLAFYRRHTPVLRTLYLAQRRGQMKLSQPRRHGQSELYGELLQPLWDILQAAGRRAPVRRELGTFLLLLFGPLTEHVLFPEDTAPLPLATSDREFEHGVSLALFSYLWQR
jgi:AcrR family transcriptional regulator